MISVAATEIPDTCLLWRSDASTRTAGGKQGILEQLGRMRIQDKFSPDDCITIASFAIQALKAGHTSREIERRFVKSGSRTKKPMPILKTRHSTMRRSMRWMSCVRWETQVIRAYKRLAALPARASCPLPAALSGSLSLVVLGEVLPGIPCRRSFGSQSANRATEPKNRYTNRPENSPFSGGLQFCFM